MLRRADADSEAGATGYGLDKALVFQILAHAEAYPWTLQELGLLGLRLGESREYRLHVWDGSWAAGEPPIHDHPFDFVSQIIAGEMTNTRYVEDPVGAAYHRIRYSPPDEDDRRMDTVRLTGTAMTYTEGGRYALRADELHDSRQLPGTVTIIRMSFKDVRELTVCQRDDSPWVSGKSRPATVEEVKLITAKALMWF